MVVPKRSKPPCKSLQVAGLFLTQVVAHLDCERQHLSQRSTGVVVNQLGIAELEEFSMDAGSAPERIGEAHLPGSAAEFPALRSACRNADAISSDRRSESQPNANG